MAPVPSPLIGILLAATGCWQSTVPEKRIWNLATGVWAIAGTDNANPKINIKLCAILRSTRIGTPLPQELPVDSVRCAAMKSRYLPNRAGECRFLVRFEMRARGSVAGRLADNK